MYFDKYLGSKDWNGLKEKRKAFKRAKACDRTCRNHGSCGYCVSTRTFFDKRQRSYAQEKEKDFHKNEE